MKGFPSLADRVQRIVSAEMPVVHLEPAIPTGQRHLVVEGHGRIDLTELRALEPVVRYSDLHCVWGWSRPACRWTGVTLDAVCAQLGTEPTSPFVAITARDSGYTSCFTLSEAREGVFAWALDGRDLDPERGAPLRFVPPARKWAYKSVKWAERVTFLDEFRPGFWEERVGDPEGTVPWDVLDRFQQQSERWRGR